MYKVQILAFSIILSIIFLGFGQTGKITVIELKSGWKFMNNDNPEFAKPDYNDANWKSISVDKPWDKQGYPPKKGFGWYRIKVVIPSSLKENAFLKDSLIFHLGKIDDFDQVFLNGEMIGENIQSAEPGSEVKDSFKELENSFWDKYRRYVVPSDSNLIKWNEENVIAIRVYDWGVAGGIFSGELNIKMSEISDYLRTEEVFGIKDVNSRKSSQWKTLLSEVYWNLLSPDIYGLYH